MATAHSQSPARLRESSQHHGEGRLSLVLWEGGLRDRPEARPNAESDASILAVAIDAEALPLDFSSGWEDAEPAHEAPVEGARPMALGQAVIFFALCLLTALSVVVGSIAEHAELAGYRDALSWEPHIVVSGETLRSILDARDLPPVESGRIISWVEEMNDLPNATIYAGQKLLMPEWHA